MFRSAPGVFSLALLFTLSCGCESVGQSAFQHFVTAEGDRLVDGDRQLRFISFNVPNLLLIEDDMAFTRTNPWRLPVRFEVEDALRTVLLAGGTVVRTYTVSVARPDDDPGTPKHVLAPGRFNEEAFRAMDEVLAAANRLGVRLIIPLVDNWKWMGGRPEYARFRGKDPEQFWHDPQLKQDFKETIRFILTRVNTVTGVPYREDKSILAWELGNELRECPREWAEEMAAFIKSIDPNHLVSDGTQSHELRDWALESPLIDVVSTHHYEGDPIRMAANIRRAAALARGRKPYYVGEFGFLSGDGIRYVLETVSGTPNVAGALIWSLRFRNRDGGFYWHSEPAGQRLYRAYHWPGFPSGEPYGETMVLRVLRWTAFKIRGLEPDPMPPPEPPELLPIPDPGHITWKGSVGATGYVVERAESPDGPWCVVASRVDEADVTYAPLFSDESAEIGRSYFYRVRALGPGGTSEPSNVVGPVVVTHLTHVDEFRNLQQCFQSGGELSIENLGARAFKEDIHRLRMTPGSWVRYWVPGSIRSIRVFGFSEGDSLHLQVSFSEDGERYRLVPAEQKTYPMNRRDYPYRTPVLLTASPGETEYHFLELRVTSELQLGRVEIDYE